MEGVSGEPWSVFGLLVAPDCAKQVSEPVATGRIATIRTVILNKLKTKYLLPRRLLSPCDISDLERVLVDHAVLHDHADVFLRISQQLDVLKWIALDQQDVGVGTFSDDTEWAFGIWIQFSS